jgi:hypothetical protein
MDGQVKIEFFQKWEKFRIKNFVRPKIQFETSRTKRGKKCPQPFHMTNFFNRIKNYKLKGYYQIFVINILRLFLFPILFLEYCAFVLNKKQTKKI